MFYQPLTIFQLFSQLFYKLNSYQKRLSNCDISRRLFELTNIHELHMRLDDAISNIRLVVTKRNDNLTQTLSKYDSMLRVLNPTNVLGRGYSFVKSEEDQVVGSYKAYEKLEKGDLLKIFFKDGQGKVKKI